MLNQLKSVLRTVSVPALSLTVILIAGCGETMPPETAVVTDATADVSGIVTIKGKPLSSGQVVLYSLSNGNSHSAALASEGLFQIAEKVPAVEYTVFFMGANGGQHNGVPEEYQSETSSTYTVTVTPGQNNLELAL